jgi:hypothetical protein
MQKLAKSFIKIPFGGSIIFIVLVFAVAILFDNLQGPQGSKANFAKLIGGEWIWYFLIPLIILSFFWVFWTWGTRDTKIN